MHIHKIDIKNFRLLKDVSLRLEEETTVLVGRNNSGKTSLTELFRRLSADRSPSFRLEDFSLSVYDRFWQAFVLKQEGQEEDEIVAALPVIEVKLTISYDKEAKSLGALDEFIIELDPECSEAIVVARYQFSGADVDALFENIDVDQNGSEDANRTAFFRTMRERVSECYKLSVLTVDPNDSTNQKQISLSKFQDLMQCGFIRAQRGLDDVTKRDTGVLSKVLEKLRCTAMSETAAPQDRKITERLEEATSDIQTSIDEDFNDQLHDLMPALSLFGYPGLGDPGLLTETSLDVERLLKDHTKVYYSGVDGINLPEAYNGLGARNLIFILFKLFEFFKSFRSEQVAPAVHLVFIEEPEVHLHPQMQEVFIGQLNNIAHTFSEEFNEGRPWPVQFVVTTHSSHVANRAPFTSIRYFLSTPATDGSNVCSTDIKDLRQGLGGQEYKESREFLHKYLTLTRCDLFFADKAILIEGITERLLLPRMIEKVEAGLNDDSELSSQYISVVEVGGDYAHLFWPLLDFLELRTLTITDLDTVGENNQKCKVSESSKTSNDCIKKWFEDVDISPADLIQKSDSEKVCNIHRLAYQVPESDGAPCGRSFEEAFILANPAQFGLTGNSEMEDEADRLASGFKKSNFALKYAIEKTQWTVPRYIAEGLSWLAEGTSCPVNLPLQSAAVSEAQTGVNIERKMSNG
jgi:predicted ATP-dependent endonuclease of OLD family